MLLTFKGSGDMFPLKVFDPRPWLEVCNQMLCADETLFALNLLDMVPGYYRDHRDPSLETLRREIQSRIATASFYATDKGCELETTDETCANYVHTLRAQLIVQDVKACNDNSIKPVVVDYAPGENWLAIVLEKAGLNFCYKPVYVNHPTNEKFKYRYEKFLPDNSSMLGLASAPIIFSCCEVIEHMHRPEEIRFDMERYIGKAHVIHCSTPKYSFAPNVTDWKTIGDLGHLRTWTPSEFQLFIQKTFPDYSFAFYDSQVMHSRLFNPTHGFDFLKIHYEVKP